MATTSLRFGFELQSCGRAHGGRLATPARGRGALHPDVGELVPELPDEGTPASP